MSSERPEDELLSLVKARVPIIQIVSYEVHRVHALLIGLANSCARKLYVWDVVRGIRHWDPDTKQFVVDDEDVSLDRAKVFFKELRERAIFLIEDQHETFSDNNNPGDDKPRFYKWLRNLALDMPEERTLIFSQPVPQLPVELEKEVHVMTLPYPTAEDIMAIHRKVCSQYKYFMPGCEEPPKPSAALLEAALGLTIIEVERAFSLAYVKKGQLTDEEIPLIIREKEQVIKKSGYLEYYHPSEEFSDVGGLGNLKRWLGKRRRGFEPDAKRFGLTYPRGILLLGIPGTGKSLTAKAVGSQWKFPLLKLDMGKIFAGFIGESERNIRNALQIAESLSPCVLWIDEIEKGLSGSASSGSTDGGTTSRVLGSFLTWMQEKQKPVFVLATANDVSQLPPELLRKGRVDEIFFVDLPTAQEREEIIGIHLKKVRRSPDKFDCRHLAEVSKGFSGAELAEAIQEALYQAFDAGEDLNTYYIEEAIKHTYPLSRTMGEHIKRLREWCKAKAVLASESAPEELALDKQTPRLAQESYNNPFIV